MYVYIILMVIVVNIYVVYSTLGYLYYDISSMPVVWDTYKQIFWAHKLSIFININNTFTGFGNPEPCVRLVADTFVALIEQRHFYISYRSSHYVSILYVFTEQMRGGIP